MYYSDDGSDRLENSLVTYEGTWVSGKHHGQGKKDWYKTTCFERLSLRWVCIGLTTALRRGDGVVYEGEFQHGQMHGSGKYILEDGYIMQGKFEHDEFMGDMS